MPVPRASRPRPLLVTAAAVAGIVVGSLDLLRGLVVLLGALLTGFDVPLRTLPVLLLVPLGSLVLAAGILALGRSPVLLTIGASALVLLDVLDALTFAQAGLGVPVNDSLGAVLAAVPVFLLLQPAARPRRPRPRAR